MKEEHTDQQQQGAVVITPPADHTTITPSSPQPSDLPPAIITTSTSCTPGMLDKEHSPLCAACRLPIEDSLLMRVNEVFWHERCLRCCLCNVVLSDSCFFDKHQRLYCKLHHYQRILEASSCCICNVSISTNDLVYQVYGRLYHMRCFTCSRCSNALRKGDEYLLHGNGDLICKSCSHDDCSMRGDPYFIDSGCRRDRREVKRPRTVLSSVQRKVFKEAFDRTPRPCRKEREKLSSQTGLSVRVVQVWFQNQRAKVKKLARRKLNKQANQSDSDLEDRGGMYDKVLGDEHVTSSVEGYPDPVTTTSTLVDDNFLDHHTTGGLLPSPPPQATNCNLGDHHGVVSRGGGVRKSAMFQGSSQCSYITNQTAGLLPTTVHDDLSPARGGEPYLLPHSPLNMTSSPLMTSSPPPPHFHQHQVGGFHHHDHGTDTGFMLDNNMKTIPTFGSAQYYHRQSIMDP